MRALKGDVQLVSVAAATELVIALDARKGLRLCVIEGMFSLAVLAVDVIDQKVRAAYGEGDVSSKLTCITGRSKASLGAQRDRSYTELKM